VKRRDRRIALLLTAVLVTGVAVTGQFFAPAQAPPPAAAAPQVDGPQLVFQPQVLAAAGMGNFPDGNLAYRWPPLVGRSNPIFYGSAGGFMARLDIPTLAQRCPPVRGLPGYYRYAAGGGAVITNPLDGSWLCVAHCERAPASGPFFWGNLGLVRSTDYGQTWSWLGVAVEPAMRWSDPLRAVGEIGGGSTCWAQEYLYLYFRETEPGGRGREGLAYVRAYDCFRAARAGRVEPWRKWQGGAIPSADDPPATGTDTPAAQVPGLPAESDWTSVAYVADRGHYLQAVCPYAAKRVSLYTSPDALTWTPLPGGPVTAGDNLDSFYPTLVGTNPDERFVQMDSPAPRAGVWLYYMTVPQSNPFSWAGVQIRRRMIHY
jgi:hypothetical protein